MANQEYEWPNCWIKGNMGPEDIEGDKVRQTTQSCTHRKARPSRSIFEGNEHVCTHPAGGDEYKTFCEPVDRHLTFLAERSQLAIEGELKDVTEERSRPSLPESE